MIQLKFNMSFSEKYYNLLCNILQEIFSTYEEFHIKLSEAERATYSKYSIVKEHKGFSKCSKRDEISCLFEMLQVIWSKVISASITYCCIFSTNENFLNSQKNCLQFLAEIGLLGELFHFSNYSKLIAFYILILRGRRWF